MAAKNAPRRQLDRRVHRLRALFRRLTIAGLPVAALLPSAGCECPPPHEQIQLIRNADAETQRLVDLCRADKTQCTALCRRLLSGPNPQNFSQPHIVHCELHDDRGGYAQVHYGYEYECEGGRGYEGVCLPPQRRAKTAMGRYLGRLAQLEAASIPAFLHLERELAAHGAPATLVSAAAQAAVEEARHVRLTSALACRYRVRPTPPRLRQIALRSLERLAVENAAQGCVRESFAALLATRQAQTAADPMIRATMAVIAEDETRHAALAHAIDEWARARLPAAAKAEVEKARARALRTLAAAISKRPISPTVRRLAGLPGPREARRLLCSMEAACA